MTKPERPRDVTGRPLPRGSASWRDRLRHLDLETALPPARAIEVAEELVLTGAPFYAHEVLEGPWHLAEPPERDFWQGLAQVAVGLTHVQRGNPVGAVTLLRRGAAKLRPYDEGHEGVAVTRVVAEAESLASRIEAAGLDGVTADDLRIAFRN